MTRSVRPLEADKTVSRSRAQEFLVTPEREAPSYSGGYVYVIRQQSGGPVKVGVAATPWLRRDELQCGNPDRLEVVALVGIALESAVIVEKSAHRLLSKCHVRGEWFDADAIEAVGAILVACELREAKSFTVDEIRDLKRKQTRADLDALRQLRAESFRQKIGADAL